MLSYFLYIYTYITLPRPPGVHKTIRDGMVCIQRPWGRGNGGNWSCPTQLARMERVEVSNWRKRGGGGCGDEPAERGMIIFIIVDI